MDIGKLNFNNIYATSGSAVNNIKTPKDFENDGKVNRQAAESGHVNIPKPISSYVTPVDFVGRMDAFDKASVNRPEQRSEFVGNNIYTMA